MTDAEFEAALKRADLIHDEASIDRAIVRMGDEITVAMRGMRPHYICVLTGGLILAGKLAPRIDLDLDFDYLHATRYRGATTGAWMELKAKPRQPFTGRDVLFVDDILDEGKTLAALVEMATRGGARSVRIAVLARKLHDRCVPGLRADFVGLEVPDRYVFGCGMDMHERGRNLGGIYAV